MCTISYFRLQPIVEVKEEVDGSMMIFSNVEELSQGRLVCIAYDVIWVKLVFSSLFPFMGMFDLDENPIPLIQSGPRGNISLNQMGSFHDLS